MAKAKSTTTTVKLGTTKSSGETRPCNICHGTGKVPKTYKKKK